MEFSIMKFEAEKNEERGKKKEKEKLPEELGSTYSLFFFLGGKRESYLLRTQKAG